MTGALRANAATEDALAVWQRETDQVSPEAYLAYMRDGDTRGFVTLGKLEAAFAKVMQEAKAAVVKDDRPAVWSVYNMGYIVKTRRTMFSIDLVHRRDLEFVPLLDFALVTHNHCDHYREKFCSAMDGAGKAVVSNFLKNRAFDAMKVPNAGQAGIYRFKDVEIRTSAIDHGDAPWAINFTMAFEIRVGGCIVYHTGDSGKGTVPKLNTVWGRPDLWLFFPGCGIEVAAAVEKVGAKRIVFGHLWELGHGRGRLTAPMVRRAKAQAAGICRNVAPAFWGDRVL